MHTQKPRWGRCFCLLFVLLLFSAIMNADWPMHGYNARRSGFSGNPGPNAADVAWTYDFKILIFGTLWDNVRLQDNASPIVGPDHTIYQLTEDSLYALNPNGTLKWNTDYSDKNQGRLAPALSPDGSRVYTSTNFFGSQPAIRALNTADGSFSWQFPLASGQDLSYSSLAVDANGIIYFGARMPATLYALNPNGTLKWSYTYPDSDDLGIEAPPAVGPDGSVYCIVNTVGLVAVDKDGVFQWSRNDNCGWYGWPTPGILADGTIVIAGDPNSIDSIIAYNPNGTTKWERTDIGGPGGFFAGIAVSADQGTVYAAREGGKMFGLNAQTGATRWSGTPAPGDELAGSPILSSNGIIYAMGLEGHLYAIREQDGSFLWKYQLNSSAFYWAPQTPALGSDGTLYAVAPGTVPASGDIPARLYAFKSRPDDLVGTWDGQGAFFRNSESGSWTGLSSAADLIASGDLSGDGVADLIGIWAGQAGVWTRSSADGTWTYLGGTARHIGAGDMNGDGRTDFLATWDGQGVFYKDSIGGAWVQMATPADFLAAGDLDGDGKADLIGIWPAQAGVWVKSSLTSTWSFLGSAPQDLASGDMNGDGRDDFVGTWDGQGVYYKDSTSGNWVKMATAAEQVAAGDLDGDGTDDLIGIWAGQAGIWVKYSQDQAWEYVGSSARDIGAGRFAGGIWGSGAGVKFERSGPPRSAVSGGPIFSVAEPNLTPLQAMIDAGRTPGPGEPGFTFSVQKNLFPRRGVKTKK
jgi:outer membrane protein assembly factor BamB